MGDRVEIKNLLYAYENLNKDEMRGKAVGESLQTWPTYQVATVTVAIYDSESNE